MTEQKVLESQKRKAGDILDEALEGANPQKARRANWSSQTSDMRALLTGYLYFQNPGDFVDEIQKRAFNKSLVEVGETVEEEQRKHLIVMGKFMAVVFGKAESDMFLSPHFDRYAIAALRRMLAATRMVQIESCRNMWASETLVFTLFRADECALEVLVVNESERLSETGKRALFGLLEQQKRTLRSVSLSRSTVVWSAGEFQRLRGLFVPPLEIALPPLSSSSSSSFLPPIVSGATVVPARVYQPVCVDTFVAEAVGEQPRRERIKWPPQHEHCGLASDGESTFTLDIAGSAPDNYIAAAVHISGTSPFAKLCRAEEKIVDDETQTVSTAWAEQCVARVELTCHADRVHVEWLLSRLVFTKRDHPIGLDATVRERDLLRGIVPSVLAHVLQQLVDRGVYSRDTPVTLLAGHQLPGIDMAGLVKYYETLSFRPDNPATLKVQTAKGAVDMNTTIARILTLVPAPIRPLPRELKVQLFSDPFDASIRAPPESAHVLDTVRSRLLEPKLSMYEDVRVATERKINEDDVERWRKTGAHWVAVIEPDVADTTLDKKTPDSWLAVLADLEQRRAYAWAVNWRGGVVPNSSVLRALRAKGFSVAVMDVAKTPPVESDQPRESALLCALFLIRCLTRRNVTPQTHAHELLRDMRELSQALSTTKRQVFG